MAASRKVSGASSDQGVLFPNCAVRSRGGCDEAVKEARSGLEAVIN